MSDIRDHLAAAFADRYRIDRELGRGGMAVVYLAQDLRHDRPVALKVLHSELATTLGPERFLREIKLAARLQHPHVLSVHDSGETAGHLWFTMPYVEGESLRVRLNRDKQLPLEEALRTAREAAEALDYAHRHGVVHRDIKPDNILLSEGHAIVADFGIGRALGSPKSGEALTETGMVVGTPAYMSPEQAAGEREIDARTDIYSLGVVLYEMLAGEPPFAGPTAQAILAKRFSGEAPRIREVRPSVPESVERSIRKALAPVPADRFQSAGDFAKALAGSMFADSSAESSSRGAQESSKVVSGGRRPRNRSALVLGLVFLLGLGVWFARQRSKSGSTHETGPRRIAVLPFQNLSRAEDEYFTEGITDEVRGKLAALPGVQVTARSSSSRYTKSTKSPQEIGRELGVQYLLTGTVRWDKAGGGQSRVRVSPELVRAATGSTTWQEPFDAPLIDVFQVQADIAGRVAQALDVALGVRQRELLGEQPTRDLTAYDLYLRGHHAWHRRTAEGLNEARVLFEQAIARDSGFARAYAGLADVYLVLSFWTDIPPRQTFPKAKAAALEALSRDSMLAEPYATLGGVQALYEWQWPAAERSYKRALALDPSNANTHHWYAEYYLVSVGRIEDAIREGRRARELDPLSPTVGATLGQSLHRAGRYDEALAHLQQVRKLDPDFLLTNSALGELYVALGRPSDGIRALEKALDPKVRHSAELGLLGYAYAKAGRRPDAERLLRELEDRSANGYVSGTNVALLLTGLGDTTGAFSWLERAAGERDPFLLYHFAAHPMLEGLRRDPRGVALLKRMNLRPN